jgi:putative ABC transport system permease protein
LAIRQGVGPWLRGVTPWQIWPGPASTRTTSCQTEIVGAWPDFLAAGEWTIAQGRSFSADDAKKFAPVCLLGQTVLRKLFPGRPNPVGEWVRVDRLRLRVIGVLDAKGSSPEGFDQDDQILLPLPVVQQKLAGKDSVTKILANARSEQAIEPAKARITQVLRQQHRLKPGVADNFDVSSMYELTDFARFMTASLETLVAIIASISLLVGGIGIMNIMLVTVTERTPEIGIRLAVGATPGDILQQFLIEAVVLTLAGGALGIAVGLAGAGSLAYLAGWPVVVLPGNVLLAFLITAGIGILFGFYPALKASRLDPIQALHAE